MYHRDPIENRDGTEPPEDEFRVCDTKFPGCTEEATAFRVDRDGLHRRCGHCQRLIDQQRAQEVA
jgi:hypothetical protein